MGLVDVLANAAPPAPPTTPYVGAVDALAQQDAIQKSIQSRPPNPAGDFHAPSNEPSTWAQVPGQTVAGLARGWAQASGGNPDVVASRLGVGGIPSEGTPAGDTGRMVGDMISPRGIAEFAGTAGVGRAIAPAGSGLLRRVVGGAVSGGGLTGTTGTLKRIESGQPVTPATVLKDTAPGVIGGVGGELGGSLVAKLAGGAPPIVQTGARLVAQPTVGGLANMAGGEAGAIVSGQEGQRTNVDRLRDFGLGAVPALAHAIPEALHPTPDTQTIYPGDQPGVSPGLQAITQQAKAMEAQKAKEQPAAPVQTEQQPPVPPAGDAPAAKTTTEATPATSTTQTPANGQDGAMPPEVPTLDANSPNVKRITRPDGGWEPIKAEEPATPPAGVTLDKPAQSPPEAARPSNTTEEPLPPPAAGMPSPAESGGKLSAAPVEAKESGSLLPKDTPPGGAEAMYSGLPFGIKPDLTPMNLRDLYHRVRDFFSIDAMPTVRRYSQDAADKLAAHASAPLAVTPEARNLMAKIMPERYKDADFTKRAMDLLNKNDILGGYDQFRERAKTERANGNDADAERLDALADNVAKSHDLKKLDAEVKAGIADPEIKKTFENWRDIYGKDSEAYYRRLKALGDDVDLESRGRYLGTRVNLKPITEETPAGEVVPGSGGAGNLRNPAVKRDKFDRMAKLTGTYDTDMQAVLENSVGQRMNETTKLDAYDALQKAEIARLLKPGSKSPKEGWLQIQGANVPGPGGTREARDLWVAPDVFRQVRSALNLDVKEKAIPGVNLVNAAQLKGIIDPAIHSRNLLSAVAQSQGGKTILGDIAKKLPGVNIVEAARSIMDKAGEVAKDTPEVREQIALLAKNAMIRGEVEDAGASHKLIHAVDTAARLTLNDRFNDMVKRGLKTDTMQNRRDFVNQAGQYNRRLMGPIMRTLKDWGIAPFVVAGRNFNRQSVRAVTGGSPGTAPTNAAAIQTRLTNVLTTTLGTAAAAATINYLAHGNMQGKAGVPVGGIYTGKDDDNGRPVYIDLFQYNLVRRGLNVTGLGPVMEGLGRGESFNRIALNAGDSIGSSQIHPGAGPGVKFAFKATPVGKILRGERPTTDDWKVREAAKEINPLATSILDEADNRLRGKSPEPGSEGVGGTLKKQAMSIAGVKSGFSPGSEALQTAKDLKFHPSNAAEITPDKRARYDLVNKLADDLRESGDRSAFNDAARANNLSEMERTTIEKKAKLDPLQYAVDRLSAQNVAKVYEAGTPAEKTSLRQILHDKVMRAKTWEGKPLNMDTRDDILKRYGMDFYGGPTP